MSTAQAPSLSHDFLDGRYTVNRLLGADDCGEVMLATDTKTDRPVAIQRLPADHPAYDRCLARFRRAAQIAERVQHPNLVAVHSSTVAPDTTACLVMDFIDGPTLGATLAAKGAIDVERALRIARDCARALQALHARDVVHRDLCPAHILLARDGTAHVTSLGDAQIGRDSPIMQLGAPRPGTPGYRSPELESGLGGVDGRSDLYSLGAILSEMLTGTPYEPALRPLNSARPGLPPPLVALVTKLLERQPGFRYDRAADVLRDLDALSEAPAAPAEQAATVVPEPLVPAPLTALPAPTEARPPTPPPPQPVTLLPRVPVAPARPTPSATPVLASAPASRPQPAARPAPPPTGELSQPIFHPLPDYRHTAPLDPWAEARAAREAARRNARPGKRGWGWLIGAIVVVFLLIRGGSGVHVTRGPTATPKPPPTATPLAATQTAIANQPTLWRDPKGRLNLTLPPGWRVISNGTKPEDVATLFSPDGIFMLIRTYKPARTIDGDFQSARTNQSLATNRTFTQGPVTEMTIGSEAGKYQEFRAVYTTPSAGNTPYSGVEWLVDHAGTRYDFLVSDSKTRRKDCDAIVASVVFTK